MLNFGSSLGRYMCIMSLEGGWIIQAAPGTHGDISEATLPGENADALCSPPSPST